MVRIPQLGMCRLSLSSLWRFINIKLKGQKPDSLHAKEFWLQYTNGLYAVPRAWAHKGERLYHAFEAVAAASQEGSWHLDMNDQALMLAGMSIEVQLKAILVNLPDIQAIVTATGQPIKGKANKIWRIFYSHNLLELAKLANIKFSSEQEKVALALSQYIYWRGRYVVPTEKGIDSLIPTMLDKGEYGQLHRVATVDKARELINVVIAEVKSRLY
jgi:hypothetical protein